MNDFKLIAIRPRKGCSERFLKVLKADRLYQFNNNYNFEYADGDDTKDVTFIRPTSTPAEHLYKIDRSDPSSPLYVHISALVGKNGSGKSVLSELLYLAIYNLSAELSIIKDDNNVYAPLELGLLVDLYYSIDSKTYTLHIDTLLAHAYAVEPDISKTRSCTLIVENKDVLPPYPADPHKIVDNEIIKQHFFYTIAINYSLYGLNSRQVGNWINSLFHKNDGYQTPIVLNPYRDEGNIDINIENDLVYQRLLSNISEPVENNDVINSLRNLANGKIATALILRIKDDYTTSKIAEKEREKEKETKFKKIKVENERDCIKALFNAYTGKRIEEVEGNYFKEIIENYTLIKLRKICEKYDRYKPFLQRMILTDGTSLGLHYDNVSDIIKIFLNDDSHITFKIKQAFNFLAYSHIKHDDWSGFIPEIPSYEDTSLMKFSFPIKKIEDFIYDAKELTKERASKLSTIELLPPAIFNIKIILNDGTDFENLSSGEKQRIFSLSSIAYHLTNLNSVFKSKSELWLKLIEYKYINIFFDEVELYFHPEFQRTYINDLLTYIKRINYLSIGNIKGINICFLTHSPFILSDIPVSNTLRIDEGVVQPFPSNNTFGANIHDLLADVFFMGNGFMGELARQKIEDCIRFLNYYGIKKRIDNIRENLKKYAGQPLSDGQKIERKLYEEELEDLAHNMPSTKDFLDDINYQKGIIDMVGEPVIQKKLKEMFHDAFHQEIINEEDAKRRIMEIARDAGIQIDFKK
jgi:hypothetical protein